MLLTGRDHTTQAAPAGVGGDTPTPNRRPLLRKMLAVAATGTLLLAAACSGSGGQTNDPASTTVSVAMKTPTWILPLSIPGKTQGENSIFIDHLYPAVFSYKLSGGGDNNLDLDKSLAEAPQVSGDKKTLTIRLKPGNWSDGKPMTSRDVEFMWNLYLHNKDKLSGYSKGGFPDNIEKFEVIDDSTFALTTTQPYSTSWFVDNQLNRLVPLPQHAWAKESADGPIGDTDRDPEGAKKIFDFLVQASKDTASYATNPLWKTTSGPWSLTAYQPGGEVKFTPSQGYTGPDKPKLTELTYRPFTGDDAEFNVLRSGGIDVGYIPAGNLNQRKQIESRGYTVSPWNGWSITYMPFNFNNPTSGPIFKQKPVRQAMQKLIDQETISRVVWQEGATPTCGPVPQQPGSAGSTEGCAYKFDPEAAKADLTSNGWKVVPDGTSTCEKPGNGPGQCGEGVPAGAPLEFDITSESGFPATAKMMAELKSQFAQAGITLTIKEVPDVVSATQACKPADQGCDWDLSFFGSQGSWYYPVYASGERLFATEAPVNLGSYSNPKADELIEKTQFSDDPAAMDSYDEFLAEDLPVLWMPNPVNQMTAYKSDIKGVDPQDPMLTRSPETWSREKN